VGFVDLDESPYRFLLYPGNAPAESVARVKRAAYAAFVDADLRIEEVNPGQDGTDYLARHSIATFPAGVLVAPEGQSLPVAFSESDLADDDALIDLLLPLVSSPLRDVLREQVVEPFCTVLLIHGDDAKLDVTTKARVQDAIQELTDSMDQLEKATKVPPHLVELRSDQRETELALLWSLGLSPADLTQPRVAVLFGRARRMGSVLRGDRVTKESLVEIMKLIGASCECGLDRKWMQGPMLLLQWDTTDQDRLAKHLGFDPESPLVKTEISQIIAQGMVQGATASAQSVMGIFEPAEKTTMASARFGEALVVEDVPLGDSETMVVEDVPVEVPQAESSEQSDHAPETGEQSIEDVHLTRDLVEDEEIMEMESLSQGTTIHDSYFVVTHFHWLYLTLGLFILVNVLGAIYLYRKRSRQ